MTDKLWLRNMVHGLLDEHGEWDNELEIATFRIRHVASLSLTHDPLLNYAGSIAGVYIMLKESIGVVAGMGSRLGIINTDDVGIWISEVKAKDDDDEGDLEEPANEYHLLPWHNIMTMTIYRNDVSNDVSNEALRQIQVEVYLVKEVIRR